MKLSRAGLLGLQVLVAVLIIGIWQLGSTVSVGGWYLFPKFFFSTPGEVALRVWSLFADGTAKIVACPEPIDISRILVVSDPCFGKTIWQHLLIT
jgi:ABC-type nitrate/sulfonate/bicarbonate transport system permease component